MVWYILKMLVVSGLLYAFYRFFMKSDTFLNRNRVFILSALLISTLLPLAEWEITFSESHDDGITLPAAYTLPAIQADGSIPLSGLGDIFRTGILSVYILGVILFAFRFIRELSKIALSVKKFGIQKKLIEGRQFRLVRTDGSLPVFTFGSLVFWHEPPGLSSHESDQILRHELAHIRQAHSFDVILFEWFITAFWFNPFFFLFRNEIRLLHEYLADREVLRNSEASIYKSLLVRRLFDKLDLRTAAAFNRSEVQERLRMMSRKPSEFYSHFKLIFLLPVLALTVFFTSFRVSDSNPPSSSPPAGTLVSSDKKVIEVADVQALPVGGISALYQAITDKLEYPASVREQGKEGYVIIQFIVEKDGSMSNFEVLRSFDDKCSEASIKAFEAANIRWNAAEHKGQKVRQSLSVPIAFQLDD